MNYRHSFHAGNFADVVKHLVLVSALTHLKKKDKPFVVIDTHGGRGVYDLTSREARRTAEHENGIGRLSKLKEGEGALGTYLRLARGDHYPGSPLIAAKLLRQQDRLVVVEKHKEEFAELHDVLRPFERARVVEGDGYEKLIALLPPPERRGVVLVDPPYEDDKEFQRAAQVLAQAYRRFATGIYMLWFPIKSKAAADAFCGEIANTGMDKLLRIDIETKAPPKPGKDDDKTRLTAAGLLVVNPPFGLDVDMREAARTIAPAMTARIDVEWLANT